MMQSTLKQEAVDTTLDREPDLTRHKSLKEQARAKVGGAGGESKVDLGPQQTKKLLAHARLVGLSEPEVRKLLERTPVIEPSAISRLQRRVSMCGCDWRNRRAATRPVSPFFAGRQASSSDECRPPLRSAGTRVSAPPSASFPYPSQKS
jgi:hypothetical protein